jgi:hypothetical protein
VGDFLSEMANRTGSGEWLPSAELLQSHAMHLRRKGGGLETQQRGSAIRTVDFAASFGECFTMNVRSWFLSS